MSRMYSRIQEAAGPHEQVLWVQTGTGPSGCGQGDKAFPGADWQGEGQTRLGPALGLS